MSRVGSLRRVTSKSISIFNADRAPTRFPLFSDARWRLIMQIVDKAEPTTPANRRRAYSPPVEMSENAENSSLSLSSPASTLPPAVVAGRAVMELSSMAAS